MESVISYFSGIGLDLPALFKITCIVLLGSLLINAIARFVFHKQTLLGHAVSASIATIFIFVVMVLIMTLVPDLNHLPTPLPFVSISQNSVSFFSFTGAAYTTIASELLGMIILAFLVNLVDTVLPDGKNIFTWIFWRIITVGLGFVLHYLMAVLLSRYLPQGFALYAPLILLIILLIMLMTGALRFLVGLLLTTVNPLIAALYTFFFVTIVGKQLTKAVLTTGILSGIIVLLERNGIASMALNSGALIAYVPFLVILTIVWYLVSKL